MWVSGNSKPSVQFEIYFRFWLFLFDYITITSPFLKLYAFKQRSACHMVKEEHNYHLQPIKKTLRRKQYFYIFKHVNNLKPITMLDQNKWLLPNQSYRVSPTTLILSIMLIPEHLQTYYLITITHCFADSQLFHLTSTTHYSLICTL